MLFYSGVERSQILRNCHCPGAATAGGEGQNGQSSGVCLKSPSQPNAARQGALRDVAGMTGKLFWEMLPVVSCLQSAAFLMELNFLICFIRRV